MSQAVVRKLFLTASLAWLAFGWFPSTTPPVYGDTSGPTETGYGWIDNQSPNPATTFEWRDIAQSGRRVDSLSSCDDCFEGGISIGFEFPFYGAAYATVGINSNGTLQFVDTEDFFGPATLPTEHYPGPVLFPLWGDWDPRSSGSIYVEMMPEWPGSSGQRAFVVQWDNVENWDCRPGNNATWQVVLLEDGRFIFQYLDTFVADLDCNYGADMTIGIQQSIDGCFLMYSYRFASVPDRTAISWSPQASECSATDATSEPGDPASITTPVPAPNPGQDGSNGQAVVGLPIDGSGPADGDRSWSSQIVSGRYFAIAGVALLLTGLGFVKFPFRRGRR